MDFEKFLKKSGCACGRDHEFGVRYVYIKNSAIAELGEICRENTDILIVADENTYNAAGEKVIKALGEKRIKKVIFSGKTILIPDERAIESIRASLSGAEIIVGIGSGVIQDLCKYVSFFDKIPYIIVATAPSMDGYASTCAAMILKGMKETVQAGLPKAIIGDTEILKNAPMEMIRSGYGDILGKFSALNDWKLSNAINGEGICRYIYDTTMEMTKKTLDMAKGIIERDEESIEALTEALIVVGIMMSYAGSSRPASGSEHHLSHFFEITGIINKEPYFPHGLDVAYSTVITAKLREEILKSEFPEKSFRLSHDEYKERIKNIYSDVADGCIKLQQDAGLYEQDRTAVYKEKEKEIRDILGEMPKAEEIEQMLSKVGIDMKDFYKMYGKEKIQDAILYAKDLKNRYTVLWLYYDMFGENKTADII